MRPPSATRSATLFPYTTLFRAGMSRKAQLFRLAPGGIQRIDGCLADDGGAIAIGNDDPGAGGQEAVLLQIADTETGGDRPEVAVAIIEIFRPFEIAAQVGDGDLDLDEQIGRAHV